MKKHSVTIKEEQDHKWSKLKYSIVQKPPLPQFPPLSHRNSKMMMHEILTKILTTVTTQSEVFKETMDWFGDIVLAKVKQTHQVEMEFHCCIQE